MKKLYAMTALGLAAAAPLASGQLLNDDLKLLASDGAPHAEFGVSVAISGTTAIVGAENGDDGKGTAYLFDTTTGQQLFKLAASDAEANDEFGRTVAISGTTAIIGQRTDDDAGIDSGSAYIFDTATGQELFKLTASDAAAGDNFGIWVDISGTTAIVGAWFDDHANSHAGAAYLFNASTGQELFKLTASDAAEGDEFGGCVAISGNVAIIGAKYDDDAGDRSGSAYLFDASTGQQIFKLTASDAAPSSEFGHAVAITGNTAIVGAPRDDGSGNDAGAAYVFNTTTGQQLFRLSGSDTTAGDFFGSSVAIFGATAVVGAGEDDDAGASSGSAYVFSTTTGQQLYKLTASDAAGGDRLGQSVAIDGAGVVVGAINDADNGIGSGSAYTYSLVPNSCPGDIANDFGTLGGDDVVSFGDFLAMLGLVGPCPGGTAGCYGDISDDFGSLGSSDGQVTFGDFLALLGLVGPCP